MSEKTKGIIFIMVGLLVIALVIFINYEALKEAYGSGPPYYSRTTNMDKWRNPLPEIVIGDLIALIISFILIKVGVKKTKEHIR
jgi:hypothetical protein